MISLISIRSKYLYRHPCLLFWSYMFLPGLIFLLSMGIIKLGRAPPLPIQEKIESYESGENYFFTEEFNNTLIPRDYKLLKTFLPNMTVIINDQSVCKDIIKFVQDETNMTINCSFYRNNYTNDTTHIIRMEKK